MKTQDLINIISDEESPVFLNREVFEMDYVPDIYKYRDEQLAKMAMYCNSIPDNIAPKNLQLCGGNATGKTTTLKQFFKMLNEAFPNIVTVYINCQLFNTENTVYGKIYNKLYGVKGSINGKSNTMLFDKIVARLKKENKILIIGLDDFDSFKSRDGLNKMLYNFLRIHEAEEGLQICIFTVSNKDDLMLAPAVETIFNRIPIVFDQYSLEQMYHILDDRCTYGFYRGVISDELIRVVANKSYNRGNLRYGIKLLSSAGQKAEVFGNGKIIRNFLD